MFMFINNLKKKKNDQVLELGELEYLRNKINSPFYVYVYLSIIQKKKKKTKNKNLQGTRAW